MGRWWKSGQISKLGLVSRETLAAGSVAALLLVAACGDDADKAAGENALETVAAVAIDPAQAPIIQKATEEYLQLAAGNAEQRVIHFSAVKVTPGSDAFDVAIENLVVGVKIGDQWADSRLEVGTVSYRLVPTAGNGYRASDLKHATEMPVLDKDNKKTGTFGMTTKAFSADWSTDIGNVLSLDWQAANIAVSPFDAAGAPDTKAGGLQIARFARGKAEEVPGIGICRFRLGQGRQDRQCFGKVSGQDRRLSRLIVGAGGRLAFVFRAGGIGWACDQGGQDGQNFEVLHDGSPFQREPIAAAPPTAITVP